MCYKILKDVKEVKILFIFDVHFKQDEQGDKGQGGEGPPWVLKFLRHRTQTDQTRKYERMKVYTHRYWLLLIRKLHDFYNYMESIIRFL